MPDTIRAIIVSNDLERLRGFYGSLFGAEQILRYPEDGDAFYVGLRIGDSELGLSADSGVSPGDPGRMLLSIEVPDVDALLPRVESPRRDGRERCQRHALGSAGRPHHRPVGTGAFLVGVPGSGRA